jgi:hypothetical protein
MNDITAFLKVVPKSLMTYRGVMFLATGFLVWKCTEIDKRLAVVESRLRLDAAKQVASK